MENRRHIVSTAPPSSPRQKGAGGIDIYRPISVPLEENSMVALGAKGSKMSGPAGGLR